MAIPAPSPLRRALAQPRLSGSPDALAASIAALTVVWAASTAYLATTGHLHFAIVLAVLPVGAWLLGHPEVSALLFGASIPFLTSVGASNYSTGLKYSPSDVLLTLSAAGVLLQAAVGRRVGLGARLRLVAAPISQYAFLIVLLLAVHFGIHELIKSGQRYELFVLPLVVGAFAAITGCHIRVLQAYVVASTLVAAVQPIYSLGQHNPIGQMIAGAILLLFAVKELRRLVPCLLVLVPGLIYDASRGAIVGLLAGAITVVAFQPRRDPVALRRAIPLASLAVVAFLLAPSSVQQRLTTFGANPDEVNQYAIYQRHQYANAAHKIIDAHPWFGVGVGNYQSADLALRNADTQVAASSDPHNVFLLQEAEGGYLFGVSFLALIFGTVFVLRRARTTAVGPAAAGVLMATFVHGLVDVYWVRGTPDLSWLVVGMACGSLAYSREALT